jgi:uncharacterized tellurite resistance protein B-like protein
MSVLPPKPDFKRIEASAPESAERRNLFLTLIGNMVFGWSNNESLFIYVLMILLNTDQASAAVVFATLNTTRARLDLIQRLAKMHITNTAIEGRLNNLIQRFNDLTRIRNEFNHCMYDVDTSGAITHTHAIKIVEKRKGFTFGETRPVDDARIKEIVKANDGLRRLNRDIWTFMPELQAHLEDARRNASVKNTVAANQSVRT